MSVESWDQSVPNERWAVSILTLPAIFIDPNAGMPSVINGRLGFSWADASSTSCNKVESLWAFSPDLNGNLSMEVDWSFDADDAIATIYVAILDSDAPAVRLSYVYIEKISGYVESFILNPSGTWVDNEANRTIPLSGKIRIELTGGTWYIKLDFGSGWETMASLPSTDTVNPMKVMFDPSCDPPYPPGIAMTHGSIYINSSSTPPVLPALNNVIVTAEMTGGKKATAEVLIDQPCKCAYTLIANADQSTLYV